MFRPLDNILGGTSRHFIGDRVGQLEILKNTESVFRMSQGPEGL